MKTSGIGRYEPIFKVAPQVQRMKIVRDLKMALKKEDENAFHNILSEAVATKRISSEEADKIKDALVYNSGKNEFDKSELLNEGAFHI